MSRAKTTTGALSAVFLAAMTLAACTGTGGNEAAGNSTGKPETSSSSPVESKGDSGGDTTGDPGGSEQTDPGKGDQDGDGHTGGGNPGPTAKLATSLWMSPADIPLNGHYNYTDLASQAQAANKELFVFEGMCPGVTRNEGTTSAASHARMEKSRPATNNGGKDWSKTAAGTWLVQQSIAQMPGTSSGAVQTADQLYKGLRSELDECKNAPGVTMREVSDLGDRIAATITFHDTVPGTGQVVLHEYLVNNGTSVSELSVWKVTDQQGNTTSVEWDAPSPDLVMEDMVKDLG